MLATVVAHPLKRNMQILKLLILLLLTQNLISQSESNPVLFLQENAIKIDNLLGLNHNIYSEVCQYDVILVGEMHGTNEPAEFTYGLCELITKNEDKVILALEVPQILIGDLSSNFSINDLYKTRFFEMENRDGRNGQAWFDLIMRCQNNPKVNLKFIDNNTCSPRDSSMYVDILEIRKSHPHTKIVTLTGNIHNWLKPFRDELKLGGYIIKDTLNFNSEKIMSINHLYKDGTMMNNTGNGLELKTIEGKENFFNTSIDSRMYLCPRIFVKQNQYSHFLYTEKVTHSNKIETGEKK